MRGEARPHRYSGKQRGGGGEMKGKEAEKERKRRHRCDRDDSEQIILGKAGRAEAPR